MRKPVLHAVDEHQDVLDAVERELRRRYDGDYGVRCVLSGERALSELTRLSDAGEDVALVLWGSVKRVAFAVGEGSIAIQLVHSLSVTERLSPA